MSNKSYRYLIDDNWIRYFVPLRPDDRPLARPDQEGTEESQRQQAKRRRSNKSAYINDRSINLIEIERPFLFDFESMILCEGYKLRINIT